MTYAALAEIPTRAQVEGVFASRDEYEWSLEGDTCRICDGLHGTVCVLEEPGFL